jgi:hypothetical protein
MAEYPRGLSWASSSFALRPRPSNRGCLSRTRTRTRTGRRTRTRTGTSTSTKTSSENQSGRFRAPQRRRLSSHRWQFLECDPVHSVAKLERPLVSSCELVDRSEPSSIFHGAPIDQAQFLARNEAGTASMDLCFDSLNDLVQFGWWQHGLIKLYPATVMQSASFLNAR